MRIASALKIVSSIPAQYKKYEDLISEHWDGKIVEIETGLLREDFNVRIEPENLEGIDRFTALYRETPEQVPPILVEAVAGGKYSVIEGRTRHGAGKKLKLKTMSAKILSNLTPIDRIIIAHRGNLGGPQPMTLADTKFTMDQLLGEGKTAKEIRVLYTGVIPMKTLEDALHWADRDRRERAKKLARRAVAEQGMSVIAAAKKFNVPLKTLQKQPSSVVQWRRPTRHREKTAKSAKLSKF